MCVGLIEDDETTGGHQAKRKYCKACIERFKEWEAAEKRKELMVAIAAMSAMVLGVFWIASW
jgi:hypothetical protein